MKKAIVLETKVICVLGVVDEDGYLLESSPSEVKIPKLEKTMFEEACDLLLNRKQQVQQRMDVPPQPPVKVDEWVL